MKTVINPTIRTVMQVRQTIHLIEPEFLPFTLASFEAHIINQQAMQGQQHALKLMRQQALLNESLNTIRVEGHCDYLLDFVKHRFGKERAQRYADNLQNENRKADADAHKHSYGLTDYQKAAIAEITAKDTDIAMPLDTVSESVHGQ